MFLSNIIRGYKKYRNTVIAKYNRLKQRAMLDAPKVIPSEEEIFKLSIDLFTEEYNDFNVDNERYRNAETYTLKYFSMHNFLEKYNIVPKNVEITEKNVRSVITNVFFDIQKKGVDPYNYISSFNK